MGKIYTQIPIFMGDITLRPHTASLAKHIMVPVSINEFAAGDAVTLEREDATGEYVVRNVRTGEFMQGPENTIKEESWPSPVES